MADPLVSLSQESKLSVLNKKIIEIKKKIQLSEGQRKANFEECDAKKRECSEKISNLKKDVKLLQIELAKAKNNEDASDRVAQTSRESSACVRKRGLEAAIDKVDEDNIRLRKKLDLVKYENDKQQNMLTILLEEYEELVNGRTKGIVEKKTEDPLKKKVVNLENQLQRVAVMQMEADTVRKKYKCVRASLKADAAYYVSSLRKLENSIREQEIEIKQLQNVKEEAIELRDTTKENLMRQEIEAMNTSKARDSIILEYRQRVEDRKLEFERLERMIFPANRQLPREDFETNGETFKGNVSLNGDTAKDEVTRLEEAFVKLRGATGVTRTEDILDRFLSQRDTKEKLRRMRIVMEDEKMKLERKRQELVAEIESQKFSETKNADQSVEDIEKVNHRITEELKRRCKAEAENQRICDTLKEISRNLWKFCHSLRDVSDSAVPPDHEDVFSSYDLLEIIEEKMKSCMRLVHSPEKREELMRETIADQGENSSMESKLGEKKVACAEESPLFPRFPSMTTPAATNQISEDEQDEVPTRSALKRQAQLIVDTKSRRKGFNFRR